MLRNMSEYEHLEWRRPSRRRSSPARQDVMVWTSFAQIPRGLFACRWIVEPLRAYIIGIFLC